MRRSMLLVLAVCSCGSSSSVATAPVECPAQAASPGTSDHDSAENSPFPATTVHHELHVRMAEQPGANNTTRMDVGVATGVFGSMIIHKIHKDGPAGMVGVGLSGDDPDAGFAYFVVANHDGTMEWKVTQTGKDSRTVHANGTLEGSIGDAASVWLDWSEPGVIAFKTPNGEKQTAPLGFKVVDAQTFVSSAYAEFALNWLPTDFGERYGR